MTKLNNPFMQIPGYRCFGCSPDNPAGLRMEFYKNGDEIVSLWNPKDHFQGYGDILHGGIQSTLMDELASWVIFILCKTAGVTRSMQVNYKKGVSVSKGALSLSGRITSQEKNLVNVYITLRYEGSDEILADADVEYFTFPEKLARRKLYFPEYESFFTPAEAKI